MSKTPKEPTSCRLAAYWNEPVSKLVGIDLTKPSSIDCERHRIFSLLVMALVDYYWNGNMFGAGRYPRGRGVRAGDRFADDTYLGHNIAAIAVAEDDTVIDFDFNHNDLFQSSIEHAESRLVRRVFALNEIDRARAHGPPPVDRPGDYTRRLSNVTIYTSLESCAQCAGIMLLASAERVVYLQSDPGQYCIGNILFNLAPPVKTYHAAEPVPASFIGLEYHDRLDEAYAAFHGEIGANGEPFYIDSDGTPKRTRAVSAFLCTDAARAIYKHAASEFESLTSTTNARALANAKRFFDYAVRCGNRGTPH